MRSFLCRACLVCVVAALAISTSWAQRLARPRAAPSVVPGQIVVGLAPDAPGRTLESVITAGAMPGPRLRQIGAQVCRVTGAPQAAAARIAKLPGVRYAEPVYRRRVLVLDAPNDPAYGTIDTKIAPFDYEEDGEATWFQWPLHTIEALEAWRIFPGMYYTSATKPSTAPKLAVVDTGIDVGGTDDTPHKEFINSGGTSPDAVFGGQVDVTDGRNVLAGADPSDFADDYGHGTAVAGVAAAAGNNGACYESTGTIGVGYHAQVLPVKAIDSTGNGTDLDLAAGILWAADHGAVIINVSAGDYFYSQAEQDAVDYAWEHGSLVIAAAGNEGGSANPLYPAACDGVLAVAATTWYPEELPASYSSSGYYLSIAAPAGDTSLVPVAFWGTWCPLPTEYVPLKEAGWDPETCHYYQYQFGTSLACPHVAGLASLYAAYRGITQTTPDGPLRIWRAICQGADDILGVPGWSPLVGWGRINAYHALLEDGNRGSALGGIRGQVLYYGTIAPNALVEAVPSGGGSAIESSSRTDGTYSIEGLAPGTYDLTATFQAHSQTLEDVSVEAGYSLPRVRFDIGSATPHAPVLSWVGSGAFAASGVSPATAADGATCTWAVTYTDADGDPPSPDVKVHIKRAGTAIADSPFTMQLYSGSDYTAGVVYHYSRALQWGDYSYLFEASDGTLPATGSPATDHTGPEVLSPPVLANAAVTPTSGSETTTFHYSVQYGALDHKVADWVELQLGAYTSGTGWHYDKFRRTDISSGSTVRWSVVLGTDYPQATAFRYRMVAGKGPSGLGLTTTTSWVGGPEVTGNSPPTTPTLTITPAQPTTTQNVRGTVSGCTDPDGDLIIYEFRWFRRSGTAWDLVRTRRTQGTYDTLSNTLTTKGEVWKCSVRATDGIGYSGWAEKQFTIANTAPTTPTLTITPASPGDADNVVATISGCVDADGDTLTYEYRWYVWSGSWALRRARTTTATSDTLPASLTTAGESWMCSVRATDGTAYTPWVQKRFTIGTGTAGVATAMVTFLAAMPTAAGAELVLTLAAPAEVRAEVLNIAGRPVRLIANGRPMPAGTQRLVWTGQSDAGLPVPNGPYLIRVTARGEDGTSSEALRTVTVRR